MSEAVGGRVCPIHTKFATFRCFPPRDSTTLLRVTDNMAIVCSVCEAKIARYNDSLKCVMCANEFHRQCLNIDVQDFEALNKKGSLKAWKCISCSDVTSQGDDTADDDVNLVEALPVLLSVTKKIDDILIYCAKIDDLAKMIGECKQALDEVRKENKQLKKIIDHQGELIASQNAVISGVEKFVTATRDGADGAGSPLDTVSGHMNASAGGGFAVHGLESASNQAGCKRAEQTRKEPMPSVVTTKSFSNKTNKKTVSSIAVNQGGAENARPVSGKAVSTALLQAQSAAIMGKCVNLVKDVEPADGDGWQDVAKRRRRRTVVVGTSTNPSNIKGVPRFVSLHAYRMDPDTKCEDLVTMLKKHFPEVSCESLKPRHPGLYASFKVTIYADNFKVAMDPAIWPQGSCISRFLFRRPKETEKSA